MYSVYNCVWFQIFHGGDQDILWLQRDFGIYVVNMFDTSKAMKALNFPKFSLQHLVHSCCNELLDKKLQKADWRLRYSQNIFILIAAVGSMVRSSVLFWYTIYNIYSVQILRVLRKLIFSGIICCLSPNSGIVQF